MPRQLRERSSVSVGGPEDSLCSLGTANCVDAIDEDSTIAWKIYGLTLTLVWLFRTLPRQIPPTEPFGHSFSGAARRASGTLIMWITQHIAARVFVWLAAVTIPMQGLPAATCGCHSIVTCSHETKPIASCCASNLAASSKTSARREKASCHCGANCQCGPNCQCGKNNAPAEPAVPPAENSSPKRIVADSSAAASFVTVYQPSTTRQHLEKCVGPDALTALDRCATLCRFTI